jgi:hypothetical protein
MRSSRMSPRMKGANCVYCGDFATCRDHIIPRSFVSTRKRCASGSADPGATVPACKVCNDFLNSMIFASIEARVEYVRKRRMRKKLPIFLDLVDDESLREFAERSLAARAEAWSDEEYDAVWP